MPLGKLVLGAEGATSKELFAAIGVNKISEVSVLLRAHYRYVVTTG